MDALNAQTSARSSEMHWRRLESLQDVELSTKFVREVPISYARRFNIIGLDGAPTLRIALSDRAQLPIADTLGVHLGEPFVVVEAPAAEIAVAINRAYSAQDGRVASALSELKDRESGTSLEAFVAENDLLDSAGSAPVVELVNSLLFEAIKRRASDVHIQPDADSVQVRLRIDGVLYDDVCPPLHLLDEIVSRIKVIGRMDIAEKRLAQDGRTTVSLGGRIVDLRISSLPTSHGERVVLRLLDKSARLYRLADLGMCPRDLAVFRRLARHTHGIILVTGPTGSGKSTTLYAVLQELDCKQQNVLTLEDPIEYQLPGISQTQVSDKKGMTFATGLRTVLRQDPDVIMVGEIRDVETARMAVQSALTGHLVLSTLHTNDAAGAVTRLLDLGIEPYLVASSLIGVLAQRLLRMICPHCRQRVELADTERAQLGISQASCDHLADGRGCTHCQYTGYFERRGIFELLEINESIRGLILKRASAAEIKQAGRLAGMRTLRQDALAKLCAGDTTVAEVLRVTHAEGEGPEPLNDGAEQRGVGGRLLCRDDDVN